MDCEYSQMMISSNPLPPPSHFTWSYGEAHREDKLAPIEQIPINHSFYSISSSAPIDELRDFTSLPLPFHHLICFTFSSVPFDVGRRALWPISINLHRQLSRRTGVGRTSSEFCYSWMVVGWQSNQIEKSRPRGVKYQFSVDVEFKMCTNNQ